MAAVEARGLRALRVYLEMIKVEHSVFALPFAFLGMLWASSGWPASSTVLWIVVAMVSCRSAAMAYNRIADRDVDALNPRTRGRAIPAGLLGLGRAGRFFLASIGLFIFAAAMLNPLALALSPVALFVTLFYSRTKRFTPLSHFVLGLSLGIAPAAAWIGAVGSLGWPIVWVTGAVTLWTAGFDVLYSLQDEEFDRTHGLRSLPESVGPKRAIAVSRACHAIAPVLLAAGGFAWGAGPWFYCGVGLAAIALAYEQSLVRPNDLSRLNVAFFTMNGIVSIGVFLFAWLDVAARGMA